MEKVVFSSTVGISLVQFCVGAMRDMSHHYEVIALSSPDEYSPELESMDEVRYIPIEMARRISPFSDLRSLYSLTRVLLRERPKMLHSITPKAGLLCMLAGWIARVPVRIHTFTGLVFPTSRGMKRRLLMLTDGITCRCATHDVFTFLYMGRIVKDKGMEELCSAFAKLYEETHGIRLLLVGFTEDHLDPVNEATRRMIATHPGVETSPWQHGDDLVSYYAACDCYVLPSYREGFPNTVLEAGAMSLPCIVTDVNGSREIIREGENGTIVPPHDAESLYSAMKHLSSDSKIYAHMARNARHMVSDRFEQGYVRRCLMEFYDEVLS